MAIRSLPAKNASSIPALPVFTFEGKIRPAAFSHGVAAAMALLREADEKQEDVEYMHPRIRGLLARGEAFGDGALVALCEFVSNIFSIGVPNLDVWVPLSHKDWGGDNCEIPPEDCMFFEVEGAPYSVEPNLSTKRWDSETDATSCPVDSIREKAGPITRAQFDLLRWKLGSAGRDAAEEAREGASHG